MVTKKPKKTVAFILVIILMSGLFSFNAGATTETVTIAETDTVASIQSRISAALATTGVTTVEVIGSKITANSTLTFTVPDGVTVLWNAVYRGTASPVIDFYGAGTLNIGLSGWVQNTSASSLSAIRAFGDNLVVSGGTVQAVLGRAIEGAGSNTVVSVTSGTVFNEATSNLRPVIDMTDATNTGVNVTVTGGEVFATGATTYGYVIQSYGNILINDGTLYTNGVNGRVINLVGVNSNVTVTGGVLQATGTNGVAISSSTTLSNAQIMNTSVTITGGFVASYATGNGFAIRTTGSNSKVDVSGGTVFAYGRSITASSNSAIYLQGNTTGGLTVNTSAPNNGIIIAWDRAAWVTSGQGVYFTGASNDITTLPTGAGVTANWQKGGTAPDGISYSYNGNTNFIHLPEVKVVNTYYTVRLYEGVGATDPANTISGTFNGTFYQIPPGVSVTIPNVPYGENLTFTVTSASNFVISLVDIYEDVIGAQYYSQSLYTGDTQGDMQNISFTTSAKNMVFRAQFVQVNTAQQNIVAFAGIGGYFDSPGFNQMNTHTNKTFTITAQAGYYISGVRVNTLDAMQDVTITTTWPGTNSLPRIGTYTFNDIQDNYVITATFERIPLNINATAGAGGTISLQGNVPVLYGDDQIFTITPDAGYFIEELLINGDPVPTTSEYVFTNVTVNQTISVKFALNISEFTVISGVGGTVSGTPSGLYAAGEFISVIAEADSGYHFTNWTIDGADIIGGEQAKPATFNMPGNPVTLTANFEPNPPNTYTLNVIGGEGGTVTGTRSGAYVEGFFVSVIAEANNGFHFAGWEITGASIIGGEFAKPATFNMPANAVTLTAIFEPNPPDTFTLNVIGAEGGTLSGTRSGPYVVGFNVEVTATANAGFRFIGWTITGATITGGNNANPAVFQMPGNMVTLTAVFEEIIPGAPPTGVDHNIVLPVIMLTLGLTIITGAELYRRGLKRKAKHK